MPLFKQINRKRDEKDGDPLSEKVADEIIYEWPRIAFFGVDNDPISVFEEVECVCSIAYDYAISPKRYPINSALIQTKIDFLMEERRKVLE